MKMWWNVQLFAVSGFYYLVEVYYTIYDENEKIKLCVYSSFNIGHHHHHPILTHSLTEVKLTQVGSLDMIDSLTRVRLISVPG